MTEVITGRYGPAHGDIISQLLTEHTDEARFFQAMAHVRGLERERDEALARANALDAQLTYLINGE